mmetsp:Transcript_1982/g.4536  ORF Transcript_1982/g.4536 Transcript_1982/m.4536 type:complete len:284 (-) Transcript_1982:99-950(-)|eukprot:s3443_g6.t1
MRKAASAEPEQDARHLVWGRPELESSSSGDDLDLFSPYECTEGHRVPQEVVVSAARSQQTEPWASSSQLLLQDDPSSSTSLTESSDSHLPNGKKDGYMMPVAWAKDDVKKYYAQLKEVAKQTSRTNRTAWDADIQNVEELAELLENKDLDSEADDNTAADTGTGEAGGSHALGTCRPCHYVYAKSGCTNGAACAFCHLPHPKRFRPRPCKSKRSKCKRLAAVLDKVFDGDPDYFQSMVEELSAQGGYLNTVVKSKVRSLQDKTQDPVPLKQVQRVLKPGLVSL